MRIQALFIILLLSACTSVPAPQEPGAIDNTPVVDAAPSPVMPDVAPVSEGVATQAVFGSVDSLVKTEDLEYGFLAEPAADGKYPGIVMIHEWWGLNDNIKEMARQLASKGYIVYAVDLYDGQVATDQTKAMELVTKVRGDQAAALSKMESAVKYLKDDGATKVGVIGWCFGGGQALQLSVNEPLDATVMFYGNLIDDQAELQKIKGPLLGIFGEEDQSIPADSVKKFGESLDTLGKDNSIYIYPGVGHAFANPTGQNFAKPETLDAWSQTVKFLNEHLHGDTATESSASDATSGQEAASTEPVSFTMDGDKFRFWMDNMQNPYLRVKDGQTIKITLTAKDMPHDFVVDELDVRTPIAQPGQTVAIEFIAKAGTYEYYCSVGQHRANGMKGLLVVER
jgi:carboxymethylenebutenolidase